MINSDINSNGLANNGTGTDTFHKQTPISTRKVALRDVPNNSRSLIPNRQESSLLVDGKPFVDAVKVCGTKRLTPEYNSSHACPPPVRNNGANEHFMFAHRKFESEASKGTIQSSTDKFVHCPPLRNLPFVQHKIPQRQAQINEKNIHRFPVVLPTNHMASMMTYSHSAPSVPNSVSKFGNGLPSAERDCAKVTSEVPQFKGTDEQQRRERFIRLQNFIKHCDESNQRENIQMLLHLSPAELSRRAVDLEKRAIQLTIEEGKEMQRMKALNILGKSATANNPLQTTQQLQSKN